MAKNNREETNIRELIKQELTRCSTDFAYAIIKYCKIEHPLKGKVLFNLYDFQKNTLNELIEHQFNIILKSRQMGISTLVAAYALMNMLFRENYKVLVIATTQDVAKNLVHKVKVMYNGLPSWMKTRVVDDNKLQLSFENGSTIKAVSSSPTAGRSEALSLLIIDEAAFVENIDTIWASSQMTLATGGDAILLSTPNGVDNLFHKLWVDAETNKAPEGLKPFNPIRLKWDLHPDRDQTWRDQQTLHLGERMAAQECDTDFLTSGHTVVDGDILKWYSDNLIKEPIEKRGEAADYWIWKYPDYTKNYVVSVDVSRGDGSDDSVIEVFDIEAVEQVAEWIGKLPPRDVGRMAVTIATDYNSALLVIENKNIGYDAVQVAIDMHYQNLYYSYRNDLYVDPIKHISKGYDVQSKQNQVPGFTTNTANRPMIVSKIERYFSEKIIKLYSKRCISQLLVFVWLNGKAQARPGRKDDAVMSTGIALFVRDTALKLRELGLNITKKALNNTHKTVYTANKNLNNTEWSMQDGRGNTISTKWLL
jgi:hypothetical protein